MCHCSSLEISQHYTLATTVLLAWQRASVLDVHRITKHLKLVPSWYYTSPPLHSPPSTTFYHPCFCQKAMIKCTHLDLYSSIVALWRFHFTPPICTPSCVPLPPGISLALQVIRWNPFFSLQDAVIFSILSCLAFWRKGRPTESTLVHSQPVWLI